MFRDFVGRVLNLFNHFAAPEAAHGLQLDVSRDYGLNAAFNISERLSEAGFYRCLPVWAEWNAQLFESRSLDAHTGGTSVVREVSYRFRINGRDPRSEQPHAFDSRLERLRWVLLAKGEDAIWSRSRLQRALTELAFLWLVFNPELSSSNMLQAAPRLMERLRVTGSAAVIELLDELQTWSQRVAVLGRTLVELLQAKSRNVLTYAQRAIGDSHIVVQQGIVDWTTLDRSRGRARDLLVKGISGAADQAQWLKHIKITRTPAEVPGNLFSVHVSTILHERALAMSRSDCVSLKTMREMPEGILNLCWVPIRVDRKHSPNRAAMRHAIAPEWKMRGGVDVWYEPELLRRRNRAKFPEQDQYQYRAAATAALAVLVYVLLQLVAERCERARGRRPTTMMLRFQTQGKGTPATEGEPLVYAVAQTVESALLRDAPVRMQGLVVHGADLQWKERGTVAALASALPLIVSAPESVALTKVATIVYSTRPCDEHPQLPDAGGHVFRAKTYLSHPISEPFRGYLLSLDRMQTHVVRGHNELRTPKLIVEEISRLRELGYDHFILQSSYFEGRRLNASAERHSIHTHRAFLEEVAAKFADVSIYMIRRDVFPATRLRKRDSNESAFEVSRLAEHQPLLAQGSDLLKQLVPIFTFATLSIVGNDDVARPQSGFCTYFLDTDYQVLNPEWRERVRANILRDSPLRESLLFALRAIHFLEAEKLPHGEIFQPVLDPYGWTAPASRGVAGEIDAIPPSRRRGAVVLSLPALLSHVSDTLHRG